MSHIPYVRRAQGRYVYRRRVHFRNIISKPVAVAMRTADPSVARARSAMMSARFIMVKARVEIMLSDQRSFLTGEEIEALFRRELEQALAENLHDAFENAPWSSSMAENAIPMAEAYRLAKRPDRPRELTDEQRVEMEARGVHPADICGADEYLRNFCHVVGMDEARIRAALSVIGAPVTPGTIGVARLQVLRGRADAWERTRHVFDDVIMNASNPLQALIELPLAGTSTAPQPANGVPVGVAHAITPQSGATPAPAPAEECLFLRHDPRRFSAVVDEIIAAQRADQSWKGGCDQQRRIMHTFAWITGDKPLGDYSHLDVEAFKRGLQRLPKDFRFGSTTEGAMSRPFAEVVATVPAPTAETRRSLKTINRDLSTMSSVAAVLEKTAWKPRMGGAKVLDFRDAAVTIKDDGVDPRPPWRREHMELLFTSPIFTGNDGPLHRLKADNGRPVVWHDAAYWVPLLLYYHHTCREETCGLRVDEVHADAPVPWFEIKDNDVRGRDGEKAGEKRIARRRKLPIHDELIRLGFLDYVAKVKAEGSTALFQELYVNRAKRGGAQFYGRSWDHMVDWIAARLPLPTNELGKGPDMHSIRALGSSFYELDGVNENIRADVMGHARTSVNGKHYSKRMETEGLETVLRERKAFTATYVPIITAALVPAPIRTLPLDQRSRVGTAYPRKRRSDAKGT